MGVKLSSVVSSRPIALSDLSGKVIAIDAFNMLYQFLATIRGPDGTSLTTSSGEVSSHLVGLFSRSVSMLEKGIKPVFVFDGKAPDMKRAEQERRRALKMEARAQYENARERENLDDMRKYASRLSRLTPEMVDQARSMLLSLGIPYVDAPSEGEAQAAWMVRAGHAWASASEDFDSLLFASPRHVRQLTISGKRRKAGKIGTFTVEPELIELPRVLEQLELDQRQLIVLGILIGTDFNPGGVRGIGPKKALNLVRNHSIDEIFSLVSYEEHCSVPWRDILDFFESPPIDEAVSFRFDEPDEDGLIALLVERFEFSESRVRDGVLRARKRPKEQLGLGGFT